jgi:hypothetical protein
MKTKSTYSILLNAEAEEKGRSTFESGVFAFIILCAAFSGWSFASTTVRLPGDSTPSKLVQRANNTPAAEVEQPLLAVAGN